MVVVVVAVVFCLVWFVVCVCGIFGKLFGELKLLFVYFYMRSFQFNTNMATNCRGSSEKLVFIVVYVNCVLKVNANKVFLDQDNKSVT